MKVASTSGMRWYLCECDRRSCREEFYMSVREYERATLGDVRLVVPEHRARGDRPLARWEGVVMVEKGGNA